MIETHYLTVFEIHGLDMFVILYENNNILIDIVCN